MNLRKRAGALAGLTLVCLVFGGLVASTTLGGNDKKNAPSSGCQLDSNKGKIKHFVYIQFDNVHFKRDNPNVPSDVEQMPHLLNFITQNGTLNTNDHTILISHTGGGILSTLTGLYPDRHGQAVSNSYGYFSPYQTSGVGFSSTFKYWTDLTDAGNPANNPPTPSADPSFNMVNADSPALGGTGAVRNAPAPWVPFTRAGCDVGNVGVANTVLENNNSIVLRNATGVVPPSTPPTTLAADAAVGATNVKVASVDGLTVGQTVVLETASANAELAAIASVGTAGAAGTGVTLTAPLAKAHASGRSFTVYTTDPTGDMTKVFGAGSPEWSEGRASQIAPGNTAARALAQTDFVGIAIHCGSADDSICNGNANAKSDPLPDEAGGYSGFKALFGAKYVNPAITGGSPALADLNGAPIQDPFDQNGFPGFDGMYAKNTLAYVAQMQEAGVPITFAYISDAHDNHGKSGNIHIAYGPGEAGYVQQLHDYDQAFAKFFDRLAAHGITKDNTLFFFTTEEEDHFAGTAPDGPCDGVNTPCAYANGKVTEVNGDVKRMIATYNAIHGTSATTDFAVHSDMAPNVYIRNNPARDTSIVRTLERVMSDIDVTNPLTGQKENLFIAMADPVEEKTLHMVTADPDRTPTFTPFARGDYFLNASSATPCAGNSLDNCVFLPSTAPGVNTFAWNHGGIQPEIVNVWSGWVGPGVEKKDTDKVWSDHTDVRPTFLSLLGLNDSYVSDGRVLTEFLRENALPKSLHPHHKHLEDLGQAWKAINAPLGAFAACTLTASTGALASDTPGDTVYSSTETQIENLTNERDALASQIRAAFDAAAFNDEKLDHKEAKAWLKQADGLIDRACGLAASF